MARRRNEVREEDKWQVETLYPSFEKWEEDFQKWGREGKSSKWPEIASYKGRLSEGAATVKELINHYLQFSKALDRLHTYVQLRSDEETANQEAKNNYGRSLSLLYDFQHETAWIEPELLSLSEQILQGYLVAPSLTEYRHFLEKIVRLKPHTLSAQEEEILALAGKPLETAQRAFKAMNDSDMRFPAVSDSKQQSRELTNGTYSLYLQDRDRVLRKNSFLTLHHTFSEWKNTLCELLQGQVQAHLFEAKARNYPSCLDAALFPHHINPEVYTQLIATTHQHLSPLHRYIELRKKAMKLDEVHVYDLYVPMVNEVDLTYSYEEAVELVVDSVAPLGKEYQEILAQGLRKDRWVDRYENENKRSGAYSSGCYESMPYILMNYQGTIKDLFTLAHEAGHSMQTLLSNRNQPFQYAQYPIFVAEVASTFHEELLAQHLLEKSKDSKEKAYLINQRIDDIRGTFFRQVLFAEFELRLHQWVEKDQPLTPELLNEEYRRLTQSYYGPDLKIDPEMEVEWGRIPHFYYNFYVYQYATGISAAYALLEGVKREGEPARKRYIEFLSSGGSRFPVELLQRAGVDMSQPQAVEALLHRFDSLVKELTTLL